MSEGALCGICAEDFLAGFNQHSGNLFAAFESLRANFGDCLEHGGFLELITIYGILGHFFLLSIVEQRRGRLQ